MDKTDSSEVIGLLVEQYKILAAQVMVHDILLKELTVYLLREEPDPHRAIRNIGEAFLRHLESHTNPGDILLPEMKERAREFFESLGKKSSNESDDGFDLVSALEH